MCGDGYTEMLSGIKSEYSINHVGLLNFIATQTNYEHKNTTIEVDCLDINRILKERNIKNIDYISLDTEGSEFSILKGIDFSRIYCETLTVENTYNDYNIINYMMQNGFTRVAVLGKEDDVYINNMSKRYEV